MARTMTSTDTRDKYMHACQIKRDTQRQTETIQRHTETHRDKQRHTETQRDKQRHTETHRNTEINTYIEACMMIIADDDVRGDLHPWATCTLGRLAPLGDLHP